MIDKWNVKFIAYLRENEVIEEGQTAVYEYGFKVLMTNMIQVVLLLVLGLVFKHMVETVLFIAVFVTVRSYCGGYHANTMKGCTTITLSLFALSIVAASFIKATTWCQIPFVFLGGVLTVLTIGLYSPIESVNKPLSQENKRRNRKKSLISLGVWLTICCILLVVNIKYADFIIFVLVEISMLILLVKLKNDQDGSGKEHIS